MGRLDELDLSADLPKKEAKKRLKAAQERMQALRLELAGLDGDPRLGPPLCIVLEGWDASGKGGAIKRLVAKLDPRHVRVKQYSAPTPDELRHPWLWRFWPALPGWGGMAILDRSWYGRVLVERVEGFATEAEWSRAYDEINSFEQTLAEEGTVLVKLWLHISDEEQLSRFEARQGDPLKAYKLTDEDWRNRGKRDAYCEAVEDMLERTGTDAAPWHLVEADSKRFARVKVIETVIAATEDGLARHGRVEPPGSRLDVLRCALRAWRWARPLARALALAWRSCLCGPSSRWWTPRRWSRSSRLRFERASREIQRPTSSSARATPPPMIHSVVLPMSS